MRRLIALIVIFAGLLAAGSAALACASAAATGDCCPAGAPSGCIEMYQQLDAAPTVFCVTSVTPSPVMSAERGRGPMDPVIVAATLGLPADLAHSSGFNGTIVDSAPTDRSLTYLHTGRLRL
jgi:hypothetical protein